MEEVEEALALVRSFDPPGIACVDLRESLLLQMDMREIPQDALARRMVYEAWDLFLRRQFPAVAKKLGVELPELEAGGRAGAHAWRPIPAGSSAPTGRTTSSPTSSCAGSATST